MLFELRNCPLSASVKVSSVDSVPTVCSLKVLTNDLRLFGSDFEGLEETVFELLKSDFIELGTTELPDDIFLLLFAVLLLLISWTDGESVGVMEVSL